MSTYRERREARVERLQGWAASREAKAATAADQAHSLAEQIPFGQPILVGHHSEGRARRDQQKIRNGYERAYEHQSKAESMSNRAGNIEAQLAGAIYSDDVDAVERLRGRIAGLEAERDRIKAYNASCRKGAPDLSVLDDKQRADLMVVARVAAYSLGKGGAFPGYHLTNLSGNIARQRKRLESLERSA